MLSYLPLILTVAIFGWANRCRGSRFGDMFSSTEEGRIFAIIIMVYCVDFLGDLDLLRNFTSSVFMGVSLLIWCSFAWDNYWSAAIGNRTNIHKPTFWPVDQIMWALFLDPCTNAGLRLWGLAAMTLRQSLAAVSVIGVAYISGKPDYWQYGWGVLALGLPYYVFGYLSKKKPITYAEWSVGGILGALFYLAKA